MKDSERFEGGLQVWVNFSCEGPDRDMLGFTGPLVSVTTAEFCCGGLKAGGHRGLPIKLHLSCWTAGWIWPPGRCRPLAKVG